MSTAGVLQLLYTADTSDLVKKTGQARREVGGLASFVESSASGLGGLFAGIGAGLAVGGVAAWVKSSMDAVNTTRVLAEQLGTSSEALSRLQYAAKLADVDSETLAGSLQKMEQRLGEIAMTGEGKAANVLRRFGVDAQELVRMDPAKAFESLVGVLGEVENPAERMKAAVDIFGKSAAGILNLAVQGKEGLAQMEAEADKLGITVSDLDAAKIDEADDAMTRLWGAVGAVGKQLAVEVAPWITESINRFLEWEKSGTGAASYVSQGIDWIVTGVGYLADGLQLGQLAWESFKVGAIRALEGVVAGLKTTSEAIDWMYGKLDFLGMTSGKTGATEFLAGWEDQLRGLGDSKLTQLGDMMGQKWAHSTVRAFVDEVRSGADSRALGAVSNAQKYRGSPGADLGTEGKAAHFGKAMLAGSTEAANTILKARFGGSADKQSKIEENTRKTAEFIEKLYAAWDLADQTGMSDADAWEMS